MSGLVRSRFGGMRNSAVAVRPGSVLVPGSGLVRPRFASSGRLAPLGCWCTRQMERWAPRTAPVTVKDAQFIEKVRVAAHMARGFPGALRRRS